MNLSKPSRRLALAFVAPLLFGGLLLAFGQLVHLRISQPISDGTAVGGTDEWIGQSFLARTPGLDQISVRAADGRLPEDQVVILHLRQNLDGTSDILTLGATVKDLRDGGWLRFKFAPLTYQAPEDFFFLVEFSGADAHQLQAAQADFYPEGGMIGGSGDLVFEVGFHAGPIPTLMTLFSRMTESKPGILGQGWLYLILLAAYFVAALGTFVTLEGWPES